MLRLAFDFIITWRETRTRPNAYVQPTPKQISIAISMGIILFIRRIVSIYAIINKPTSGFVAETEHFSPAGV